MSDQTVRFAAAAYNGITIFDFWNSNELLWYDMSDDENQNISDSSTGLRLMGAPAVVITKNGRRHIVGQQTKDKRLWHFGPNTSEVLPQGNFASTPTMCSWGDERLDVFILGGDDQQIYHCSQDKNGGKWAGWYGIPQLPNGLKSAPAATSWGKGRIDIVARGQDDAVWHICYDLAAGGWMGWHSLGAVVTAAPTLCALKPNRLDVFARGQDQRLWHIYWDKDNWYNPYDSTNDDWADEAGGRPSDKLFSAPVAVTRDRDIYVFALNYKMAVIHTRWTGSSWSRWIENLVSSRFYML